jgi:hypothetical protein
MSIILQANSGERSVRKEEWRPLEEDEEAAAECTQTEKRTQIHAEDDAGVGGQPHPTCKL